MKKTLLITGILICSLHLFSQDNYSVSWGNAGYDTLTDYTSILYDIFEEPLIENTEVDINFGFNFPFFDDEFSVVTMDGSGYGYFYPTMPSDYNLFMFAGDFESHTVSGLHIFSDWRYKLDTTGDKKILKVEWRNIGLEDDVFGEHPTDHRINYQVWFYENGIIEYHFGEINLLNTPFYTKANGFIGSDGDSYGPWIGILNEDASELYFMAGTNFDVSVITEYELMDIFHDIPLYGRYFRFTPDELESAETVNPTMNAFTFSSNPVTDEFEIRFKDETSIGKSTVQIFNLTGELVQSESFTDINQKFNITSLSPGIYFVRLTTADSIMAIQKLIKK
ncbi:MAG: T9SS type A sorting domain-containing protein [Lentimicrobiaceae bacterium]